MKLFKFAFFAFLLHLTPSVFAEIDAEVPALTFSPDQESSRFESSHKSSHKNSRHKNKKWKKNCCQSCQIGNAIFSVTDMGLWYEILTLPYPQTVPLSLHENGQQPTQGHIILTDTGLTINEAGNYQVSFQAILLNLDPTYTAVIPVFVAINGVFDPTKPVNLGSVVTLPVGFPSAVHGSGVMQNVPAGTTLSLVATNGGSPEPQPVTVVAWDISVFKIPCKSKKS